MVGLLKQRWLLMGLLGVALLAAAAPSSLCAQTAPPVAAAKEPSKAGVSSEQQLATQQRTIADRYEHLEQVLLRMAELTASTDPRRSALLRRAVAESKDRRVSAQFGEMVGLLSTGRLSRALEGQKDLDRDLRALLELLVSENRQRATASEKARIREYIRQVGQILRSQKSVQGRTAGGEDAKRLAGEQKGLAQKTGDLAKDVRAHDPSAAGDSSGRAGEKPDEKSSQQKTEGQGRGGQENPSGPQAQGSSEGQPSPQQASPVQKNLGAARQRMRDAQKQLEAARREQAVDDQEEAIRQLEQAKAELEQVLRQLREEEIERTLTLLEARFKQMLDGQRFVYLHTKRLDRVPASQRSHEHEIEAGRLSQKESLLVLEADRALLLLREDGSSTAFPEAVSQIRDDMQQVVLRLAGANVGPITRDIEEAILRSLEEMITALERAISQQQARRSQQQPPQGQPQDPPLVDQLAELRMIRALQVRVNQRTARYSKLIDGEQTGDADLLDALHRLARYQARIHRITRDLESGKNQ